ncbi:MAG: AAA family ATPase [Porphyromonadaceae bacterium CG2_30_38_12]|nr:MAG: AAA family ATPase [Porphyromonadaceae bacterium CG2_30_38_12]
MESFYKTHNYLIEHVQSPIRRQLMDEIDWSHRLIGIKGSRGVGKTTFLLQYAKEHFGINRCCLYVNFNNFYFTQHTLEEFAEKFSSQGGKTLLLDQTFKYENWSKELRNCYDRFPNLKIIFTGSSVMRLKNDNPDLHDIIQVYNLRGFSFREFLNHNTNNEFKVIKLEQLTKNHVDIARSISNKINPLDFFSNYLEYGYYPFHMEKRDFSENLLKTMNMMLEVDILLIKQIDLKYLSKIRKLLYLLIEAAPAGPNVSQLSNEIETSRATIMNYIKYLKDARLINLLYAQGDEFPKKPKQIYVQNTNIMHTVFPELKNDDTAYKTFFYNSLRSKHKVNIGKNEQDFCIDQQLHFKCDNQSKHKFSSKMFYAVADKRVGQKNEIPLWLFGFLY